MCAVKTSVVLESRTLTTHTMTTIYDLSLDQLQGAKVDISPSATLCRYRLVDCIQFVEHENLRIDEFSEFPNVEYTAISYVWRGRPDLNRHRRKVFTVAGAEGADPITIDVLRHACAASVQQRVRYIWLDRLCIIQTSKADKIWQIRQMFRIYKSCTRCIVLPDGLCRLVSLSEETDWIHRGWTLQEAMAPKNVVVLFTWTLGPGRLSTGGEYGLPAAGAVTPVIPGVSAVTELQIIIDACAVGFLFFTTPTEWDLTAEYSKTRKLKGAIFGARTPNIFAFAAAMNGDFDDEAKSHAIWRCALMRTSSRPVDMVFSIMGLFGVDLDPRGYNDNDRVGATIALAKAILQGGGSASWLGIAFRIPPSPELPVFPDFPQTSVAGKALVRTHKGLREVADIMEIEYPSAGPKCLQSKLPGGSMDDSGQFFFRSRYAHARRVAGGQEQPRTAHETNAGYARSIHAIAADETEWEIYLRELKGEESRAFAVFLGWFDEYYPGATPLPDKNIKIMILEEHEPGRCCLCSFASLKFTLQDWVATWDERDFCIGPSVSEYSNAANLANSKLETQFKEGTGVETGMNHK
ncbi:hypothetical protein OBBRIDRAFT_48838 [Obba rivulosa]|uniref:Heterokaryon incompatibility domain-containing protein n=1 Tax=Obba rivulosa TaxID=1052685 RepID=A0A8E2DS80_9APHY|nr:hypothetical protein OBBRIDRAFT_48838 [Obba rivulosa]